MASSHASFAQSEITIIRASSTADAKERVVYQLLHELSALGVVNLIVHGVGGGTLRMQGRFGDEVYMQRISNRPSCIAVASLDFSFEAHVEMWRLSMVDFIDTGTGTSGYKIVRFLTASSDIALAAVVPSTAHVNQVFHRLVGMFGEVFSFP